MKTRAGILGLGFMAALALTGCASYSNSGGPPGAQSGSNTDRQRGEYYQTETLTPGVGSALFPDPGWR